jgi:ABC-2 type transport system permease protein
MTVFSTNLKRIFGRPINIILMLVVPLVLNILFISVSTEAQKYNIGVIDNDNTKLTEILLSQIEDEAQLTEIEDDDAVIRNALLNSEIDLALKIEKDYSAKVINGEKASIQTFAITETNQSEPMKLLLESLTAVASELGRQSNGDAERFYQAMEKYTNANFSAKYESFGFSSQEQADRTVTSLGYLAMGMMFLMSFATALLLEDKEMGVFSRITTTPITRGSYMLQHLLSYIVVAVIQIVLIFLIVPKVVDISFGSTTLIVLQVMFVTFLFACVCIAIGLVISRFAKNTAIAGAVVSLVNFPVLMLGGCMWPKEIMPTAVQKIGSFMPSDWFLSAARKVVNGEGLGEAIKEIGLMVGLVVVLLVVSFVIKTDDK